MAPIAWSMSQEYETVTLKLGVLRDCRRFGLHTELKALNICRSYCIEAIHLHGSCWLRKIWAMLFNHSFAVVEEFSSRAGVYVFNFRKEPFCGCSLRAAPGKISAVTVLLSSRRPSLEMNCIAVNTNVWRETIHSSHQSETDSKHWALSILRVMYTRGLVVATFSSALHLQRNV